MTVQPTEASARATASNTRSTSGRSAPMPPWVSGRATRKHPAATNSSSRSGGRRRAASTSAARAAMAGASVATRSRTSAADVGLRSAPAWPVVPPPGAVPGRSTSATRGVPSVCWLDMAAS